jgi:hypothetical protein
VSQDTAKSDDWLLRSVKGAMAERGINVVHLESHFDVRTLTYIVAMRVKSGDEHFTLKAAIYNHWYRGMEDGRRDLFEKFIDNFTKTYEEEMERLADLELFTEEEEPPKEYIKIRKPRIKEPLI